MIFWLRILHFGLRLSVFITCNDLRCGLFAGDNPCPGGQTCHDGIGTFTCCSADPSQNRGQCCMDDPAWSSTTPGLEHLTCPYFHARVEGHPRYFVYCSQAANAAGVTAAEACPNACQSGCAVTYDDCCAFTCISPITKMHASFCHLQYLLMSDG